MLQLDLGKVAAYAARNGYNDGVRRYPLMPYDWENALAVVQTIGEQRDPSFVLDEQNRFAYYNVVRWLHADPAMQAVDPETGQVVQGDARKGLYIAGPTGSGKSWLLEVMAVYAQVWRVQVFFQDKRDKEDLTWRSERASDVVDEYAQRGTIARFVEKKILCLQDFGQEAREVLYMGNRQNALQNLIEARGDSRPLLTLISSNLHPCSATVRERYGERAASRLKSMFNFLPLVGEDRRR